MPRQPLTSKGPNQSINLVPGLLGQRPQAAILIAECIATWTEVEMQFARLLSRMLKARAQPAIALYFSLKNERQKTDALKSIADHVLNKQKLNLFNKIITAKMSLASQRNDLAHGLFGISECSKEGVIWISTTDRIKYESELSQFNIIKDNEKWKKTALSIRKSIYVYEINDLERLRNDLIKFYDIVHNFAGLVSSRRGVAANQLLAALESEPLLQ